MITPRSHFHDFSEMMTKNPELLTEIGKVIEVLVDQLKIRGKHYTWGFHCGGKQSIDHVHANLLAGMTGDETVL
jgi:diadenosine tetraphosphate (Ap4A) HIT family hydrolase